jgi:integrase
MRACLSSIFRYAIKEQSYLSANPVAQVPSRTEKNKRTRFLSDEERNALLTACHESDWNKLYLLVLMALTTGARLGELLGLHWDEIDFKERTTLLIDTKNGDSRILTIPESTINELQRFREVGSGLVFPSPTKFRKPFEFRKHWHKAMADAGIEGFRFHDLRHSCASMLVMNGATLYEAGQVLGHKSQQTTARYAHLSTGHKQALTDRILGGVK